MIKPEHGTAALGSEASQNVLLEDVIGPALWWTKVSCGRYCKSLTGIGFWVEALDMIMLLCRSRNPYWRKIITNLRKADAWDLLEGTRPHIGDIGFANKRRQYAWLPLRVKLPLGGPPCPGGQVGIGVSPPTS